MRNQLVNSIVRKVLLVMLAMLSSASIALAQTSSFTYQGRFTDGGTAANGTYEMQFRLFDALSAGNQIGSTITTSAVSVSNGVFTVQLDYGASAFSGADRFLEIGVRPAGDSNPYTFLAPRQQLTSAAYAIRSGSATSADNATTATNASDASQLGGIAASQYVQTGDSRLSDARAPKAGSGNYIQNTSNQQTANFNISGNGTAGGSLSGNSVDTATDYKIGGQPALSVSDFFANTFAGLGAGLLTAPKSGPSGAVGDANAFFGSHSGASNTSGRINSFFGAFSGGSNKTGVENSFFGAGAGSDNTQGNYNTFVGSQSGQLNTTGSNNVFVGYKTGPINQTGNYVTMIGSGAASNDNLINATAIGAQAWVTQSNSLVLGGIKDFPFPGQGPTADTNVGIGTTAPKSKLHIASKTANLHLGETGCQGILGIGFLATMSGCGGYSLAGNGNSTFINRPNGGAISFQEGGIGQVLISPGGAVKIANYPSGGSDHLCVNNLNELSTCGSSLRYKTNIQPFISGMSVLNRLRPITFDWKAGGKHDLGFGAEEIAAVEPLLVTHNDKGEIEGVKYDRITAVLVNAVKEQQEQIRQQQDQLKQQQQQINSLRRLVATRPGRRR